jgi:hypothetical protein
MVTEDLDAFLFEFDILCRSYDYSSDAQKLRLFPATLKGAALRWFMGLGEHTIAHWDDMCKIFLKKYQAYCKGKNIREDIFEMTQRDDESLEDYLEIFLYNIHRSKNRKLDMDIIKTIFLRGIKDESIDFLNLMGSGDVSHFSFEIICDLCRNYSQSKEKSGKGPRDIISRVTKSTIWGVTREELGNLLENFKTDILGNLSSQLDTLNIKRKQEEENTILSIFCPRCRKKHPHEIVL